MESKKEMAVAILKSFETGDIAVINKNISNKAYIQHNLNFADGKEALLNAMPMIVESKAKVNIKRIIAEGDMVAIHTEYDFFGPKAGFDVFRFEDNKIIEHWDNLQSIEKPNASGHTMFDGAVEIKDMELTQENKLLVSNFITDVLMDKNPSTFASYFNGNNYIQHNPQIADGLDGLSEALKAMAANNVTMIYHKIHHLIAEGNFVLAISEGMFANQATSFYDLFRIENNKIAEHWDVVEHILEDSKRANKNSKF